MLSCWFKLTILTNICMTKNSLKFKRNIDITFHHFAECLHKLLNFQLKDTSALGPTRLHQLRSSCRRQYQ